MSSSFIGTEFLDNVCEVCPDGTFSATNMSYTCQPWTRCEEEGMREEKAGTATSDAVCVQRGLSTTAIAVLIVLALSLLSAFAGTVFFLWRRGKRKYGGTPAQETGIQTNTATPLILLF
nr:tumor necrosis factor receptor superfamily member 5-like isoform X2 [Chrysemys picta bellii]